MTKFTFGVSIASPVERLDFDMIKEILGQDYYDVIVSGILLYLL